MKTLKNAFIFIIFVTILACKSSERVITKNGKIYTVKGNTIKKNGSKVNDDLSASERDNIYALANKKKNLEVEQENKIEKFENAIKEQEQIEKDAKQKQKELKDQLDAFTSRIDERQDLKDDFVKMKEDYNDEKRRYNKLKKNGSLTDIELKEWKEKLKNMKDELAEARQKF